MTTLFVLLKHSKATDLDHNLIVQDPVQTGQKNYPYTRRNVTRIKQQSSCRPVWEYKENYHLCHINNILIILGTLGSWLIPKVFRHRCRKVQRWKHLEQSMRQLCWCMWHDPHEEKREGFQPPVFWLFSQLWILSYNFFFWSI